MATSYYSRHVQSTRDKEASKAIHIGRDYMEGKINIADVERYLNHEDHSGLKRDEVHKYIRQGVQLSEEEGKAKESRKQPIQEDLGPRELGLMKRKGAGRGGKLTTRPEHTRYKAPTAAEKKQAKAKRGYAARPGGLNAYDVKAQRKKDLHKLLEKHAKGQAGVKEVKKEAKTAAHGSAYKNIVYNETHHRYVGPNREGAPRKKEWDYQPKRRRKKG